MAKANLRLKSAVPQEKVRTIRQTPARQNHAVCDRTHVDSWLAKDGLKAIRAISDVMDYLGESGKTDEVDVSVILAGLAHALEVAHGQIAEAVQA